MTRLHFALGLIAVGHFFGGCGSHAGRLAPTLDDAKARAALQTYAAIADAAYGDAAQAARELSAAVDALLAAPSPATLEQARNAWLQARKPYAQTEVFRFYDGPIDAVETWVNTWPIDENYVEGDGSSGRKGLIDDGARYPVLSADVLASLNLREGETSVSTGFHVVELLLWGRDDNPTGPGQRPHTDFVQPVESAHAERSLPDSTIARRRAYLRSATALLAAQLAQVAAAWSAEASGNYRTQFLGMPPSAALGLAVKGMGSLSGPELSGERLTVPYETKDQENEHSCFSDSTCSDLSGDTLGVQNVCLGGYQRRDGRPVQGVGVCAGLTALAPAQAARLEKQIAASVAAVRAIPPPFDRAILGTDDAPGRKAIAAAIRALQDQSETLAAFAQVLHVGLKPPLASAR